MSCFADTLGKLPGVSFGCVSLVAVRGGSPSVRSPGQAAGAGVWPWGRWDRCMRGGPSSRWCSVLPPIRDFPSTGCVARVRLVADVRQRGLKSRRFRGRCGHRSSTGAGRPRVWRRMSGGDSALIVRPCVVLLATVVAMKTRHLCLPACDDGEGYRFPWRVLEPHLSRGSIVSLGWFSPELWKALAVTSLGKGASSAFSQQFLESGDSASAFLLSDSDPPGFLLPDGDQDS